MTSVTQTNAGAPVSYSELSDQMYLSVMRNADNKENIASYVPPLCERIKTNGRKTRATKNTMQTQSKALPTQCRPVLQQMSTGVQIAPKQLTPPLEVQAASEVIDLSSSTPLTTLDADKTQETKSFEVQIAPGAAGISTSAGLVRPQLSSGMSKRNVYPASDFQPPKKRRRSLGSHLREAALPDSTFAQHALFTHLDMQVSHPEVTTPTTSQAPSYAKVWNFLSSGSEDDGPVRTSTPMSSSFAPSRAEQDIAFIQRVKDTLLTQSKRRTANVGKRQARRILQLLKLAKSPDETEALYLTSDEAKAYLQPNAYFPGLIFTEGQQSLELQTIQDFLSEQYDDEAKVHIQDPSLKTDKDAPPARVITMGKLKEQFQKDRVPTPFNCLELAAHVEDGFRPKFLNTEDCRLLTKLKHPSSEDQASRRGYLPGWKEVEKWALLAKAGALTEPHQDSHGYSTYITVNQGTIGFGWLANPTPSERAAWRADPSSFTAGSWRYAVLRPGQTVYFPAGTVHFVFRHPADDDTLAFGGHVLRCSQIVRWVGTLLEERQNPDVTNEDLSVSAPEYLGRVERFVRQALVRGDVERWGGREGIEEFLRLKEDFLAGGEEMEGES